jgi:hypothetical protein
MTIKKRLIFALMQIRDWMMPESIKERSEFQMKIAKQINKLIRKLTPKEEYEQSLVDCEKRARALVGIDSFDTPSIGGTASKD